MMTTMDRQTTILETERLLLRRMTLDDLDALWALYADRAVSHYVYGDNMTYAETQEELEWILSVSDGQNRLGLWATVYKPTGEFIGRCGLLSWTIDERPEVEVAYMLAQAYWGQGLGTEVGQALVAYGFEQLQLSRLICLIKATNQASINVARKLGMRFEKEVKIEEGSALLYGCSK